MMCYSSWAGLYPLEISCYQILNLSYKKMEHFCSPSEMKQSILLETWTPFYKCVGFDMYKHGCLAFQRDNPLLPITYVARGKAVFSLMFVCSLVRGEVRGPPPPPRTWWPYPTPVPLDMVTLPTPCTPRNSIILTLPLEGPVEGPGGKDDTPPHPQVWSRMISKSRTGRGVGSIPVHARSFLLALNLVFLK